MVTRSVLRTNNYNLLVRYLLPDIPFHCDPDVHLFSCLYARMCGSAAHVR